MTEMFTTQRGEPIPVIVRAATISSAQPPDDQCRVDYAMSTNRGRALELAVGPRMKPWALGRLLSELAALQATAQHGDTIIRREYGRHGYLEVTILQAHDPLASRYPAVSRLADGERELYLDALIDDALADRAGVRTITLIAADAGDPRTFAGAHGPAAMRAVVTAAP